MSIEQQCEWRELPFRGELSELVVEGNGKGSRLRAETPAGRALAIALSKAGTSIVPGPGVEVSTTAPGELSLSVRFRPAPGRSMRVTRFRVLYPGTDEQWEADCRVWQQLSASPWTADGSWAVPQVVVELATHPEAEPERDLLGLGIGR